MPVFFGEIRQVNDFSLSISLGMIKEQTVPLLIRNTNKVNKSILNGRDIYGQIKTDKTAWQ